MQVVNKSIHKSMPRLQPQHPRTRDSVFVLYAEEIWPLTLKKEHKLKAFERRIFGLKMAK
jgi:hypothetical protein